MAHNNINNLRIIFVFSFFVLAHSACAEADKGNMKSYHVGLAHPSGVDFAGYSVEKNVRNNIYYFYTFGFPSMAATGFTYYKNQQGKGLVATVGVGIGSVMYGSIAYQWEISQANFVKLGAGIVASIAYSGVHPVISYEHRFH